MSRIFIDARQPLEFRFGHVPEALNIPPTKLLNGVPPELASTDQDAELVVYCHSGMRAKIVIEMLRKQGFTNLTNGVNQDTVSKHYAA